MILILYDYSTGDEIWLKRSMESFSVEIWLKHSIGTFDLDFL